MKHKIKFITFLLAKYLGLFWLARYFTKDKIRILGYHGIWFQQGHFGNHLNLSPEKFKERMLWLKNSPFNIVSLEEAYQSITSGQVPRDTVVITIDDGWYSSYNHMLPALESNDLKSTLYVTTAACDHQKPIWHLVAQAAVSLTNKKSFCINWPKGTDQFIEGNLKNKYDFQAAINSILLLFEKLSEQEKKIFTTELSKELGIDLESWISSRQFSNMTYEEIKDACHRGMDIQLHTHNHNLKTENPDDIIKEVEINRELLEKAVNKELSHFCYPSGVNNDRMRHHLKNLGIKTATLVDTGFVSAESDPLSWKRILDGEQVSLLEFEAELSGFVEIFRKIKSG